MGLLGSYLCEVVTSRGVDDASGGIDQQTAIAVHTVLADFLKTAALGTNAWNQQEVVGNQLADVLEHTALGGTNDIHHIVLIAPLLALLQHFLKEALAIGILRQLEVVRALVRGECQQDDPLVVIAQEWCDAVFAHIGGNGECIDIIFLEEGFGIHLRRVADITTLGISNDEVVGVFLLQVVDGGLESQDAIYTVCLVESQIGLVGHTIGGCGIDNQGIKLAQGAEDVVVAILSLCLVDDALGYLVDVGIETNTEKR